jgi:hydrogenase maturation protease
MQREKETDLFLVLGMGNSLLRDVGIGPKIVESAEKTYGSMDRHATFKKNSGGGIDLLYDLVGYGKAIIVDALTTGRAPAGYCHEYSLPTLDDDVRKHCVLAHGISLTTVFRIGRQCGYPMPAETVILAVETEKKIAAPEQSTPSFESAMDGIIRKIGLTLFRWRQGAKKALTNPLSATDAPPARRWRNSAEIPARHSRTMRSSSKVPA